MTEPQAPKRGRGLLRVRNLVATTVLLVLACLITLALISRSDPISKLVGMEFRDEDIGRQRDAEWTKNMGYRYVVGPCDAGVVHTSVFHAEEYRCASNTRIYGLRDQYLGRADSMVMQGEIHSHLSFVRPDTSIGFNPALAVASGFAQDRQ